MKAKKRDPKGLYAKAQEGLIPNFTGINSPYEEPHDPDIILDTDNFTAEELTEKIFEFIKES